MHSHKIIRALSVAGFLAGAVGVAAQQQEVDRSAPFARLSAPAQSVVTLLGTNGGPGGNATRAGVATLVTVNGTGYLFDAGEAVVHQAAKAGNPNISHVFITHLHSDHTAGLFSLMMFRNNLRVYGPPRTTALVDALKTAIAFDTDVRGAERDARAAAPGRAGGAPAGGAGNAGRGGGTNPGRGGGGANAGRAGGPPAPVGLEGMDVVPGVVYRDANVTVEALENSHYGVLQGEAAARHKSYSYRIRTPDRVFVITGDTGWSDALVQFSAGADILFAEMVSPTQLTAGPNTALIDRHLFPYDIGRLASMAKIKMVVPTHLRTNLPEDTAEMRRMCSCQVIMGEDLMTF
jgi:ribonuclease BN (tRNA processing enzyme)